MAKILITFLQPIIAENSNNLICYYEGLAKELSKNGNSVKILNQVSCHPKNIKLLTAEINQFNPDIIFTFNNQIRECILENTNCPVALFDADGVDLFVNIDLIKKYLDRYFMVTSYPGWDDRYGKLGFNQDRIVHIAPATSVQSEKLPKDKNISFIGSNFNFENCELAEFIEEDDTKCIYNALNYFWRENDYNYAENLKRFCKNRDFTLFDIHSIFDSRVFILSSILDLGLNLYGLGWERLSKTNYPLSSAFDREPKFSLGHNQDVYNSSKINLSISHPQTNGYAFPWRIYDIMASDGMLISTQSDLLTKFTKDFVEIPMYSSPYDARDLCKKYLKEDNLRAEIVEASNKFIEKYGRWDNNFKILEEKTNVKLLNNEGIQTQFSIIDLPVQKVKHKLAKLKIIFYSSILFLSNLPLLEKLFSNKSIKKIHNSIEKYRRK